jgi:hypothetical protein
VSRQKITKAIEDISNAKLRLRDELYKISSVVFFSCGKQPGEMSAEELVNIWNLLLAAPHLLKESQEQKGPPITRPAQAEGGPWKC